MTKYLTTVVLHIVGVSYL